ncbi:MAG: hypothetical protein H7A55_08130 [Verrucomicrobiaceae bacterium]|nr:hypothetical protein [Verrucomicrobiaceae bacterium]
MKAALVINTPGNDDRIKAFASFWLANQPDAALFLASADGTNWCSLSSDGAQGRTLPSDAKPTQVDCLFVHGGDFDSMEEVKEQLSAGWTAGFIFNGPGDPQGKDGFIRILRSTSPFSLMPKHRQEIVSYTEECGKGNGGNPVLPSCCLAAAKYLVAVDILAQGFLFAHGLLDDGIPADEMNDERRFHLRKTTSEWAWWQRGLGLEKIDDLEDKLLEDKVSDADAKVVVDSVKAFNTSPDFDKGTHPLKDMRTLIEKLLQ